MPEYIDKMLTELHRTWMDLQKKTSGSWVAQYEMMQRNCPRLVRKLLHLSRRTRQDIQMAVSFFTPEINHLMGMIYN